jgi:glycosyltransferase involved in cell wall biosynthesis
MTVRDNRETVQYALESVAFLVRDGLARLLVADLGSTDGTPDACRPYGAQVIRLSVNDDMAQMRSEMARRAASQWHFWIEPWESILQGGECIAAAMRLAPAAYRVNLVQGDLVTKPTRLWHKNSGVRFENPAFESLVGPARGSGVYLAVGPADDRAELVRKWREREPLANEPIYYEACLELTRKNWRNFVNLADLYLHQEKGEPMSAYMLHYYSAMVRCYVLKEYDTALRHLIPCVAKMPLMSEFWCLLGDVYYATGDYERAKALYENGMILGSRRPLDDGWPMEISKYRDYPEKMIAACDKVMQSLRVYTGRDGP